jgi:ParB-like chromosome segregation protein Spo0J
VAVKRKAEPAIEWPADRVERRPIEELLPYARNARQHTDAQVAQIAASIREWGWTIPVLIDETGTLIAGHGRVLAARQLSIETIPTMIARGWTEAQIKAYRLADNKLSLNSEWDIGLLKVELGDLRELGVDLQVTGFRDFEFNALLSDGVDDPDGEWQGMPGYDQRDRAAFRSIVVHFKDQAAVDAFAALIEQTITEKTRFLWYPPTDIETYVDKKYAAE